MSLPTNRNDAIELGETKYQTGKPCLRGHITWRYTNNGACEKCLHPRLVGKLHTLRSFLCRSRFAVNNCDVDAFELTLLAAAVLRDPTITMNHLRTTMKPRILSPFKRAIGYRFFMEDEPMLRELERHLCKLHDEPIVVERPFYGMRPTEPVREHPTPKPIELSDAIPPRFTWPEGDPR